MTTLTNSTGSKAVNIRMNEANSVIASYVQIYKGEEQVLQTKFFANTKNAEKWGNKMLG
jgi:hypothetical protein